MAGKLFVGCGWVIRALIDIGNDVTKPQCLGSIILLETVPGARRSPMYRKEKSMYS